LHAQEAVTLMNLSDLGFQGDRYGESLGYLSEALEGARRAGSRRNEWFALSEMSYALTMLGRWDEALARYGDLPSEILGRGDVSSILSGPMEVYLQRGELAAARELLARFAKLEGSSDVQSRSGYDTAAAVVLLVEGRREDALAAAERSVSARDALGIAAQDVKHAIPLALEASLALGRRDKVEELLVLVESLPIGLRPPFLDAAARRFRARLAGDSPTAGADFGAAAAGLRRLELPFHLAVVLLEHGEWLLARSRAGEAVPLLAEARETFEHLRAQPWLDRLDAAEALAPAEVTA
jgi:tetratricopeptide (TPR) repeat protein